MKEAWKVMALFVAVFLIVLTPWVLLRRQSASGDSTIYREPVTLETAAADDESGQEDSAPEEEAANAADPPKVSTDEESSFSTEEQLDLITRTVYFDGTYAVTPLNNGAAEQVDRAIEQLQALQACQALPPEIGFIPQNTSALDCQLITFYAGERNVQVLYLFLECVYGNPMAVAMDLDSGLLYTVAILGEYVPLEPDVDPAAYLAYLSLDPEATSQEMETYEDGFWGTVNSRSDALWHISFEITNRYISYSAGFLEALGLMPF